VIFLVFVYRVRKYEPDTWNMNQHAAWYSDWRALVGALAFSCVGIIVSLQFWLHYKRLTPLQIRSVYRTVELSFGFEGPLSTNESLFYGLDTLPLYLAIFIYVPFWPGRFISSTSLKA